MGYIGVITQLLTIDPNFLGHPSWERTQPCLKDHPRTDVSVVKNHGFLSPLKIGLFYDPFQMAKLNGLWMGVALTTY